MIEKNDRYNLINCPNQGGYLFQQRKMECTDQINKGKITDFIKSKETNSPNPYSGATSKAPIGNSFLRIGTSSNSSGNENLFVGFERTDIVQINKITFCYNRFSTPNSSTAACMARLGIQLLIDGKWQTRYTIGKLSGHSSSSTEWTLLNLDFNEKKIWYKVDL